MFILPQHKIIVIFVVLFAFIGSVLLVHSPSFWTQSQNKLNFTAFFRKSWELSSRFVQIMVVNLTTFLTTLYFNIITVITVNIKLRTP